ncbi:MAG: hypothetical protein H6658_00135 [Ardenticatenaceae bacterium]|nr:hypothetical protein [Ardenticatenaceae bacterium]
MVPLNWLSLTGARAIGSLFALLVTAQAAKAGRRDHKMVAACRLWGDRWRCREQGRSIGFAHGGADDRL